MVLIPLVEDSPTVYHASVNKIPNKHKNQKKMEALSKISLTWLNNRMENENYFRKFH